MHDESVWLPQKRMAELFGVQRPAITKHLKNIFQSGELNEDEVSSILEDTTQHGAIEGKTQVQEVKYYNLDAILSVGYRVNSSQATQFRIWATKILREYIIKGFAMDDDRLKNGQYLGKDYFKELHMGLTSLKNSPDGRVLKSDTSVAKNYLSEDDIKKLERTIGSYFDYIERIIENRQELSMKDVSESVNKFLEFNEFQILEGKGRISHIQAKEKASKEYEEFNKLQKIESDFDKEMKKFLS